MNTATINSSIRSKRDLLLQHPLYHNVKSIEDLRHFAEGHVYAVWDFMSLLKALQAKLTCTGTPWLPVGNPELRYLINQMVLTEESDINAEGQRQSHYEMYLDAMKECGADTLEIENFIENVIDTQNIFVSIKTSGLHNNIKDYLDFTFRVIDHGKPHEIAAAFTFGREDLIPAMFVDTLKSFREGCPEINLDKMIYSFERYNELHSGNEESMAMKMISQLCGTDVQKWKEVEEISLMALDKRAGLWDAIQENMLEHDMASI